LLIFPITCALVFQHKLQEYLRPVESGIAELPLLLAAALN